MSDKVVVYVRTTVPHPRDKNVMLEFNDYITEPTDEMVERGAAVLRRIDAEIANMGWLAATAEILAAALFGGEEK